MGADAQLRDDLAAARQRTLDLVAHLSTEDLERVVDPILSPLVWDLGHIAAYEDLWCVHRHDPARPPLLHADLAALYDAFETPRAVRGDLEILGHADALSYLEDVRERTLDVLARHGAGDGTIHEMVLRHELQHTETMRQAMALGGLLPPGEPPAVAARRPAARRGSRIPGGTHAMGAPDNGFAYDNERPRHAVDVPPFEIARRPVTNASWLTFAEGGGYVRREWWSDEGWAWKEEYDITHHAGVAAGDPDAPACHVSWFEADAFARAHDARLPTEAEWEKAATSEQLDVVGAVWEWTVDRVPRLPRLRRPALPRVLRGLLRPRLPRSARRLVGDASARRDAHLPQLGSPRAPADLRRRPPRPPPGGLTMEPTLAARADRRVVPARDRGRRRAGRRRPRRPDPPVQGAAAQAPLRRPWRRPLRPDLRAARVLPDAHRAGDPRGALGRHRRAHGRRRARRARLGHRRQDPHPAARASTTPARCGATSRST